ncbi:YceI family protein [Rhodocaloribacter sp.]
MKPLLSLLGLSFLFALLATTPARAQVADTLTLQPESRLWIEGTSNKKKAWRANAGEMTGSAAVVDASAALPELVGGSLTISSEKITGDVATGKFIMNRLIREALKVKEHPEITFTVENAETVEDGDPLGLLVAGTLTLAGVSRPIEMTLTGERTEGGGLHLTGQYGLSMPDFEIKPPSIRTLGYHVGRDVVVHFDLLFAR